MKTKKKKERKWLPNKTQRSFDMTARKNVLYIFWSFVIIELIPGSS